MKTVLESQDVQLVLDLGVHTGLMKWLSEDLLLQNLLVSISLCIMHVVSVKMHVVTF